MINKLRRELRIKNNVFDDDIQDLIEAAKIELKISGVNKIDDKDTLIKRAITLYAKANFGFDNPDSEKLQKSFESLKDHLALSGDYNAVEWCDRTS